MKSGLVYFSIVFGAGFVLGTLRVLVPVPRFGERYAELMELPVMIAVSYIAARLAVRWFAIRTAGAAIATGLFALGLLVVFEATLVLGLRGLTFAEILESRDPISFWAYVVSLIVFAVMPVILVGGERKTVKRITVHR